MNPRLAAKHVATTHGPFTLFTPTPTATTLARDDGGLPALPTWFIHFLAGMLSFLLVVGVVLFLAQFPETLGWLRNLRARRRVCYRRLEEDEDKDGDEEDGVSGANLSTRAASSSIAVDGAKMESHRRHMVGGEGGIGKEHKRHQLSIDTSARYKGLGIAVPGSGYKDEECGDAFSMDECYDGSTETPTLRRPWLTAPLPSVATFFHSPGSGGAAPRIVEGDVESGRRWGVNVQSSEIFGGASPVHGMFGHDGGILEKVNAGITHAAARLGRKFHSQVVGAEEGLVLPVREEEREGELVEGEFVG